MAQGLKTRRPLAKKVAQIVEVDDLTAGVNLRVSPTLVAPAQSVACKNWSLEEPGALVVRPGYTQFTPASFGSSRAQGGQRIYLSSHTFTLLAHNSSVHQVSAGGALSSVLSGLSSTSAVHFAYDRDLVAVFDSTSKIQKSTDGSTWSNFGIEAPLAGPVASTLSSGVVSSGEYVIAYSYKNRALSYESDVSSGSTITLTGSTGALHGQATASTDVQVDAYVWYARDKEAGETVLRKVSSGPASTVRITDTNWTQNDEAPTTHGVLQRARFGVVWKNRWWFPDTAQGNRLHFSELFLPQAVPATFYIDLPFERGDIIRAVAPLGDYLVCFGDAKVYLIIGQTSLDFEVRPSAGAIAGCLGQRAWTQVEQGLIHAAAEGIYVFDGATDRLLSHNIDKGWRAYITSASPTELALTPMVYEFRRQCVRVAVSNLYPYGTSGEWELNLDRTRQEQGEAWCHTDRAIGGYIPSDGAEQTAGLRGELVSWSNTTGLLWKESTGTTANSSNMVAEYEGPTLSLGLHRAMVTGVHVEYEPHGGALASETRVDGVSQGSIALSIGSGLAVYGSAVYGTATYGGSGRRKAYTEQPLDAEGRTITHLLTYTGQERAKMFTYAYDIVPETAPSHLTE